MTETSISRFEDLGLRQEILSAVVEAGYVEPTPIQARAIPAILSRRDVIGIAQTGTGKTASFVLPMLQILASGRGRARMPRSLILSPTRELATQTARNFEIYGKNLSLTMALLIGGVGMGDQERLLEKGVDVLIATPGRLLDWYERGRILLGGVEIMVIDEADRMFDMGFLPDVERIVSLLLGRKQTLLFSATMPPEVRRLADRFLRDPIEIQVARPASTAATVEDVVVAVDAASKRDALVELIRRQAIPKAIVFCNRKRDIGPVMRHLQRAGFNARDLHGDLEQVHRQATLDQFTRGQVDFLVATDVAARGLDISDMPVVINFDVPMHAEDYVHRIGRTGRAGRQGRAFTFVTPEDARFLAAIEKLTKRTIPRLELAGVAAPAGAAESSEASGARRERSRRTDRTAAPRPARAERGRTTAVPAAAASRQPEPAAMAAEPTARRAREQRAPVADGPVVAFGDHVPAFLMRAPTLRKVA
ncbi:MAG: DEAD/DEAH box helicase [Geminicoccaceae bacterium]|nr:DEAD/DEAH box helicase [Geminicoccaceae bacterium]MCX8101021.1 DEAD/DEAH box helicase [Geminicoccaceae bacterium]MDW8370369.1 DEAD/DEAH box helicase [Geminicoccaceae bacterium]